MPKQPTLDTVLQLQQRAYQIRIDSIRATTASKSGHPTSCLSAADIIAALYFNTLRWDHSNPHNPNNDRFILSKGHAIPVVYAAWKQLGIISDQELLSLRQVNSPLEGHPTPRFAYNEAATGSLGQGLGIGVGMALHAKRTNRSYTTYVMMGDGEISEGSVWEAADLASHYHLTNLIAIVDCNHFGQSDEAINRHDADKIAAKFTAFGWHAVVINGHDMAEIMVALGTHDHDKPLALVAKTYKGYGLEQIENKNGYHGKPFKDTELPDVFAALAARFAHEATTPALPQITIQRTPQPLLPAQITLPCMNNANKQEAVAPRKAYGIALADLGNVSEAIVVLDADVKNSTFADLFEQRHANRFTQCFIAEQNMVSVATGMALRGDIPFAATFGAFFTRAHDQIRMAAIGKVPLRLAGSHCGVSIGEDGPSQMALEDIGMMRALPGSIVLYPSDAVSAYALTGIMANYYDGISYIRTTRESLPQLYQAHESFAIGGCKILKQSNNDIVCIITAGITVHEALKAHATLAQEDIAVSIIDLYSIKPFDVQTVQAAIKAAHNNALIVEDHYAEGGIGEAVTQTLCNESFHFEFLAIKELSRSGKPAELMRLGGIDAQAIQSAVRTIAQKQR